MSMGDFNSHSQSWRYDHIDNRGEEIEAWQDDNNIIINRMTHRLSTSDDGTLPKLKYIANKFEEHKSNIRRTWQLINDVMGRDKKMQHQMFLL